MPRLTLHYAKKVLAEALVSLSGLLSSRYRELNSRDMVKFRHELELATAWSASLEKRQRGSTYQMTMGSRQKQGVELIVISNMMSQLEQIVPLTNQRPPNAAIVALSQLVDRS